VEPVRTVAFILALFSVFPLLRLIFRWDITMNGNPVPMWMSGLAFLVFVALAVVLWRSAPSRRAAIDE
jgi:hypothetical protein